MKTRIMLDLETLGTAPGSAILAIGAVKFGKKLNGAGPILSEFYKRVDLKSCIAAGLTMDPSTVLWWFGQNDQARMEVARGGLCLTDALHEFKIWAWTEAEFVDIEIWGNGAAFDNALLAAAYDRTGVLMPWKYSNDRCYRTVKNLYPDVEMVREGTHHNALDDARSQAMHLMAMLPSL